MSHARSHDGSSISPGDADRRGPAGEAKAASIGRRFNQRWAEDLLEAAFASAGHALDAPRSIGVLEVSSSDGHSIAALLDDLGPDLTLRIRRSLPRGARLVFAHGARFVMALPGDPLLEALLIVDRVRDALERESWQVDGERVELVFDAGVSTRHTPDEPLSSTLEAAERSLIQSHRVTIHRYDAPVERDEAAPEPAATTTAWSRALQTEV
jgi:hypothetical protein